MGLKAVKIILGLAGHSAPHVVRYDASKAVAQPKHEVPVIERPGRVAVEHEHGLPHPFIKIMQTVVIYLEIVMAKGINRPQGIR